ncbi:MAG: glutathione S-transferase family protein [Sneathiella sp.]|nr:glutathione S-transferase family protein [Sneathiella sp.]
MDLTLISHILCPYAQRVSISLMEKGMEFTRINVDLSDKPQWFRTLSPLGKVPLLKVKTMDQETILFESSVILEYLEETGPISLYSKDPLQRAQERSWIAFGSAVLNDIAGFYSAKSDDLLEIKRNDLREKFARLEEVLSHSSWFSGDHFTLVDAIFAPVFRYFDVLETFEDFGMFHGQHRLLDWRARLSERPSVQKAVPSDYPDLLREFLLNRKSALSARMIKQTAL